MQLNYKFKLYPNKEQQAKLSETLELSRWTYNYFLGQWKAQVPNSYKLQAQLPKLKVRKPELKNVYSKVLQMVLFQLYSNLRILVKLKKNGKRVGRLRFKSKNRWKVLNYNQSGFRIIKTGGRFDKLHLSKIGNIPIRIHREIEDKIKGVIIKRYGTGEWFAIFQVETEPKPLPKTNKAVGIDMGLKHFLTDSDGRQIENPKFYERTLQRIRTRNQDLAKKKKGSKNRNKALSKLIKVYQKLTNQRDDFLHKLSRFYINNYDFIAIEELSIAKMVQSPYLAGRILSSSWGVFFQMLFYKAEGANKIVQKVDPRNTSREYNYGKIDRDYNASLNILARALPQGLGDVKPVEMEPLRELVQIPASSVIEAGSPLR